MRLLVIRSGSGWGGIYSKYIIDTDLSVLIDIDKHNSLTDDDCCCISIEKLQDIINSVNNISNGDDSNYYESAIRKPISEFDNRAVKHIDFGELDVSNLEDRLSRAVICHSKNSIFDIQVDDVYALINDKVTHLVSTSYPLVWIDNEELRSIIIKITGIDGTYTMFLT